MLVQVQSRAPNKDYEFSGSYFFIIIMLMDTQNSFAGQAPASAPEPQAFNNYNQPKKKSAAPIIIALVLLVLALGGTTAFLLLNNNNKDNNTASQENNKEEEKETEISSETVKQDLFEKMKIVLLEAWNDDFKYSDKAVATSGYDFPFELFKNGTHNDGAKFYSISTYFDNGHLSSFLSAQKGSDYAKSIYARESGPNFKVSYSSLNDFLYDTEAKFVEGSTFDAKYKAVYGEDIKVRKTDEYCGGLLHDSTLNIFYTYTGARQCGGAAPDVVSLYIDSYSKKGDEAYIDFYGTDAVPAANAENKQCAVWPLENANNTRKCNADEAKILNGDSPYSSSIINESNKESYSHYRFVFSGENSDYHFVKVEKIEKK